MQQPYQRKVYRMEFLEASQWWNLEKLKELQLEGLKNLVDFARKRCSYYRDLPKIKEIDDIKQIPILTKSLINQHFNEILVSSIPHVITTTGGTISKVTVAGDKVLMPSLGQWRFINWYPVPNINKRCYLWGSIESTTQIELRKNMLWLPVEGLRTINDAKKYLDMIIKFKPTYLKAYARPLYILSRYAIELEKTEEVKGKVGVIVTHCETLTSIMRKTIEDVFGCEVFNFYGSRDLGSQAQDCNLHKDLHIYAERYIIESIDGKLLFTDLLNYASPLIRYENQDVGEFSSQCKCGRGLPTLKPIVGRILNYLQTKSGDWVSAFVIYLPIMYYDRKHATHFFDWVESYQIRQRKQGELTVLLKPWSHVKPPKELKIQKKIIKKYASDFNIDLEIVNKIPLSRTGKQLAVDTTLRRWEW